MRAQKSMSVCAMVGLPNAGKSSLFNAITGLQQKVGNWSGVTVGAKQHSCSFQGHTYQWIDLPGLQDLQSTSVDEEAALDEDITRQFLTQSRLDLIVNVVDVAHLEQQLYLTMQLRELGLPMLLVLNKFDVAKRQNIDIDTERMSAWLQCPVITASQHPSCCVGIQEAAAEAVHKRIWSPFQLKYAPYTEGLLRADQQVHPKLTRGQALATMLVQTESDCKSCNHSQGCFDVELDIASTRYRAVEDLLSVTMLQKQRKNWDTFIDAVVLHPWLGLPVFGGVMYLMFVFSMLIGGAFNDFFDIMAGTLFVDYVSVAGINLGIPTLIVDIMANGVGKGIQTVLTFIPIISSFFLALSILETSGYFARAAFVVDGFMQKIGLPGKAFVPMIVGFGCSVPAIMATRSLNKKRERLLVGMMSPFMSCSARLPVYALFAATFFAEQAHLLVLLLYIIGIFAALLTGWLLSKTLLPVCQSYDLSELPSYQWPKLRIALTQAYRRTVSFILGSGKTIVMMVTLLTVLDSIPANISSDDDHTTILQYTSQQMTPIFEPMGITANNWPAIVGLITGFFAKEVVVGSLNHLYQAQHREFATDWPSLSTRFQEAIASIGDNFVTLKFSSPLAIERELNSTDSNMPTVTRSTMIAAFGSTAAAFAYVIFILLYTPCVSALGASVQEFGKRWAFFSALWSLFLAYAVATTCYQVSTLDQHAWFSCLWLGSLVLIFTFIYRLLARFARIHSPSRLISMIEIN